MSKRNNHLLREERIANRRRTRPVDRTEVFQGMAAALHPDMPAMVPDCESVEFVRRIVFRGDIERAHGQALAMDATQHVCFTRDCALADWECELVNNGDYDAMFEEVDREDQRRREARYDHGYGGYSGFVTTEPDPEYVEDSIDTEDASHWIAYCSSMEEVREVFGGTDFIIIHKFRERA